MSPRSPLLIRASLAADRVLTTAAYLHYLFWEETLWAWTQADRRDAANQLIYGNRETFLPGGATFEGGLYDWEEACIHTPPFPQTGRILLGGAGGGRELSQLCKRGFHVVAFEPCERYFHGASQVVSEYPGSSVICASYADLVAAVTDRSGPLAGAILNQSFDAVLFGWGSINYVLSEPDRLALLRAVLAIAPKAPLLLSFNYPLSSENGRLDCVRPALKRLFKSLGAPSSRSPGDHFRSWTGFFHGLTEDDLVSLAAGSGYRVVSAKGGLCPHALLEPVTTTSTK
jgi:hypothetical protein